MIAYGVAMGWVALSAFAYGQIVAGIQNNPSGKGKNGAEDEPWAGYSLRKALAVGFCVSLTAPVVWPGMLAWEWVIFPAYKRTSWWRVREAAKHLQGLK